MALVLGETNRHNQRYHLIKDLLDEYLSSKNLQENILDTLKNYSNRLKKIISYQGIYLKKKLKEKSIELLSSISG